MQMLAGGAMLLITSIVLGDWRSVDLAAISARSIYALIYLILFGAVLGFTAYSWLLKNANPAIVATYAYVNPVIAVILGWLILGEGFTGQMLLGAGVVVGSVALITSQGKEDSGIVEEDDDLETPSGAADGRRTASATA
jgi:drug/metabolite transporter (DMT)-like permease